MRGGGWTEHWRVSEEGHPLTARRCSCPDPIMDAETCVLCGREASIRLGPSFPAANPRNLGPAGRGDSVHWHDEHSNCLPTMSSRRHIGFVAPPEMFEELHELAASRERTVSQELRLMVRQYLAENERSARPPEPSASEDRVLESPARDAA